MKNKSILDVLNERTLVLDGAMGTQIFSKNPTIDDYGGVQFEGCVELLNERRKNWIQDIHASYLNAGADAVETNTFGCNEIVLSEFDIAHRTFDLNLKAAQLATEVARSYNTPKFVIGSVGPGTKLVTLGHVDAQALYHSYLQQMRGLIEGGVDAILIETAQDLGQIKTALRAGLHAMRELQTKTSLWVQVTIETTGSMLLGSDIQTVLTTLSAFPIDVIGLNCATGPDEMAQHVNYLCNNAPFFVSMLPNAGLPENKNGKTVYPLGPKEFAAKVTEYAKKYQLDVVGGCCGTTPEHIFELSQSLKQNPFPKRTRSSRNDFDAGVTSLYHTVPYSLEPKPLFVGERTNANGSKLFKNFLAANDYESLIEIAKEQLKEGAHILDVCVAYVGRDEKNDMSAFLDQAATKVDIPIMIDSTETGVIERALQKVPGKCIVNSINFEDGEKKARDVLALCKEYGSAVIGLTIDENGMAKTTEDKIKIAQRIYKLAVEEFHFDPRDLIIDPLTFTLASGEEEFRKSAICTLDAITQIKKQFPGVKTILGLSNISFGFLPHLRQLINSIMLYHATKCGLDMAILNAAKILPLAKITEEDKVLINRLIFDERLENEDPLKLLLKKFSTPLENAQQSQTKDSNLPLEDKLQNAIVDGEKKQIGAYCLEALKKWDVLHIINTILLGGMKIVGERFASGEMQLPFVLESAQTMKEAVKTLEPFMEKNDSVCKGKILLATVKGDVHDIGKNLVDIILSNNGFQVVNLGIKQPIENILSALEQDPTINAVGMSGLLVKSTVIMNENLQFMQKRNIQIPVILGGAALTREFVEQSCRQVYDGQVFYAQDAFEGLGIMERLMSAKGEPEEARLNPAVPHVSPLAVFPAGSRDIESEIRIVKKAHKTIELNEHNQSAWVQKQNAIPVPPFWGTRIVQKPIGELFPFLDEFSLVRNRWGFVKGNMNDAQFEDALNEKAYPALEKFKSFLVEKGIVAKSIYGYFPVQSEGNSLYVYNEEKNERIAQFHFPRQNLGRRLCISDFFANTNSGMFDVLGVQIVTLGNSISEITQSLYADNNYTDYFYLHGLGTELTEAFAEMCHQKIRKELGIHNRDSASIRQLFSQGYQGSRYSFGYPACPDMEDNETLLKLLNAQRIGVNLSESFQMVPEMSTSAIVAWHPQARYFNAG